MADLVNRLRGKYAMGPQLPNGEPEFGWRQFKAPPIQQEAADEIERLRGALIRIEDLTQHGIGMDAGEETVVWREAHNALKQKETD